MTRFEDPSVRTSPLQEAFLADHQRMTRGLTDLMEALRSQDDGRAARIAAELDREVGAHIEFEEERFYPVLVPVLGAEFVQRLYREHGAGRSALERLTRLAPDARLTPRARGEVVEGLGEMLAHAESCGTLVSHLDRLDAQRQRELLDALRASQGRARRWTERPTRRHEDP